MIGQAPGPAEAARGRLFVGQSGRLLHRALDAFPSLAPLYYTNAVACAHYDEPSADAVNACRTALIQEVTAQQPKRIILMGNAAVQALCPGSRKITDLRPDRLTSYYIPNVPCIPTYNVAAVLYDPDLFRDVIDDLDIAENIDTWVPPNPPKFTVVDTVQAVDDMLVTTQRTPHIALDIETTGFNPTQDRLLTVGLGDANNVWIITAELLDQSPYAVRALKYLLEHPDIKKAGQNWFQFDWKWLYHLYGIDAHIQFDTMLASYVLDERSGEHSLKKQVRKRLGYPRYADDIKGQYESYGDIPTDLLYQYQAWDIRGTYELVPILQQEMEDEDVQHVHTSLLLPAAKALAIMELRGVQLDTPYLEYVRRDVDKRLAALQAELQIISDAEGATNLPVAQAHVETCQELLDIATEQRANQEITGREWIQVRAKLTQAKALIEKHTFNPNSPLQVRRLMWDKLRLTPDTTRAGLEAVEHLHAAPHKIAVARQLAKLKGTYVDGLIERLWTSDNRLHGAFLLHGARTGRIASQNPNLQNISRAVGPIIRNAFIAQPGWILGEADLSQVEMRVAGMLANDTAMIELFRRGGDIHKYVAAAMYGIPEDDVTKDQRQDAKPVGFAILYGATEDSLVGTGDPPWDQEKAHQAVQGFYEAFPDLARHFTIWQQEVFRDQELRTLTGRVRRFPLITESNRGDTKRIAINSRIQGLASDILLSALTRVQLMIYSRQDRRFTPDTVHLLLTVHDSILFETHPDTFDTFALYLKQTMEDVPFDARGMPFVADIKQGYRWGSLVPWDPDQPRLPGFYDDGSTTHLALTYQYQAANRASYPLELVMERTVPDTFKREKGRRA